MKNITTRLALFAVVLTVAVSVMVAPAVAAPGDKVTVTDPDRMDEHTTNGVMPGDNTQFIEAMKASPAPEDRYLQAKKAFDGALPDRAGAKTMPVKDIFDEFPGQGNDYFPGSGRGSFDGGNSGGGDDVCDADYCLKDPQN